MTIDKINTTIIAALLFTATFSLHLHTSFKKTFHIPNASITLFLKKSEIPYFL